jgi:FKBP12-rapamycin complex-associated protein
MRPNTALVPTEIAEKCEAWAKALHYKEIEFRTEPGETCEALISINHKLDLPEAAAGVLHCAQEVYHIEQESWYEKLQRWETALQKYEAKQVTLSALLSARAH